MHQQEIQNNKMQLKNMNMELPYVYNKQHNLHVLHGDPSRFFVIIRHSESKFLLKILAQALILALLIMVLAGVFGGSHSKQNLTILPINLNNKLLNTHENQMSLVFQDLSNEGLWKTTKDESHIVSNTNNKEVFEKMIKKPKILTISPSDTKRQLSVLNETYDFSFTNTFERAIEGFIDRILKIGGIMAVQLNGDNPSLAFEVPPNYKIVYFRKFIDSTFIAMRKMDNSNAIESKSATQRKLLHFLSEEKKAVLGNLEDVLLEPPRSATGKSKTYLRKTKFLPDLLNDSLEGYSRRVYIDVGGGHGSTRWFEQNYPTRNKDFDIYRIETVPKTEVESPDDAWEGAPTQMGISDWLWRNVKMEEYVVMKADAEVVEEMLNSKAIALVDELFLECKPFGKGGSSKRAYWECLALYGRLRDFGVAVHQWWG